MNPLYAFKEVNYLPKALALLDCIDQPGVKTLYDKGLFHFVSSGQYVSEKLQVRVRSNKTHDIACFSGQCYIDYFTFSFSHLSFITFPSSPSPRFFSLSLSFSLTH